MMARIYGDTARTRLSRAWQAAQGRSGAAALPSFARYYNSILMRDTPPLRGADHVIFSATRATGFIALSALNAARAAGHEETARFIILGGKKVTDEPPAFTKLLQQSYAAAGIDIPTHPDLKEHDLARIMLRLNGIDSARIITDPDDESKHTQANADVLKRLGFDRIDARLHFHTLAANGYRALGTVARHFSESPALSVTNVFPHGIDRSNWYLNDVARMYASLEAAKALPPSWGGPADYVRRGFMDPVDFARIEQHINRANQVYALQHKLDC